MKGKILKLANNDLYGNASDRTVSVFAAFTHLRYMNRYIIFAYTDELDKKKLYYGSVHIKTDSLVVFQVNDNVLPFINTFISEYLSGNIDYKEYEIIDISNINKLEFVTASVCDFDKLHELDNISIKKEVVNTYDNGKKSRGGLYFLLSVILLLLAGVTYLYFNPGLLSKELKELTCKSDKYNKELEMKYRKELYIKFDKDDKPITLDATETYKFSDVEEYDVFVDNGRQNEYFIKAGGSYRYYDDSLELKVFYPEKTIIDNYDELYSYLKHEGYTCEEGTYYE